jgi:hypothetical protein
MMDKGQKLNNPKETGPCEQIIFGPKRESNMRKEENM